MATSAQGVMNVIGPNVSEYDEVPQLVTAYASYVLDDAKDVNEAVPLDTVTDVPDVEGLNPAKP